MKTNTPDEGHNTTSRDASDQGVSDQSTGDTIASHMSAPLAVGVAAHQEPTAHSETHLPRRAVARVDVSQASYNGRMARRTQTARRTATATQIPTATQTPAATQDYDIRCDSFEDYKIAAGDTGLRPAPGLPPGTRVLREDGNVYIVTGDTLGLKTLDGKYVVSDTLEVLKNQDAARLISEMTLEEE